MSFFYGLLSANSNLSSWKNGETIQINNSESLQKVKLTKKPDMKVDFGDVRFVVDPSSGDYNSLFLEYDLVSQDATFLYYRVAVPFTFTNGSILYAIWGNPDAEYIGNPQRVAFSSSWVINTFDRGINYDIVNVFNTFDVLLDGPGNASQEANWSCLTQNPIFQTAWGKPENDDWLPLYVGYKYDADDNIHAGSPTSKSALKYSLDFGLTFSARQFISDPDANYRSASSTSLAIPTVGATAVSFTVPAGRAWQTGDVARAFADGTHYFWFTVTSYSGTTLQGTRLSNTGTGSFSSWVISQKYGTTNTVITSVKMPNGVTRLVAGFATIDFYLSVPRVYSSYSDLTNGIPGAWSSPVLAGPNSWANVGGKGTTMPDGTVCITMHENAADTPDYASGVAYSFDYGVTWQYVRTVAPGSTLLDETDLMPILDENLNPTNMIRATCRNEDTSLSNHQFKYLLTRVGNTLVSSDIQQNDWYDSTLSRYTSVRCPDKKTVIWAGGDATEKMIYSTDNLTSFNSIPFATLTTGGVTARRVYTTMAVHPDGRMLKVWSSNRQPNGSDLYLNYFDWTLNTLYCDTANTLTNGVGAHNRPRVNGDGIRIGEFLPGYRTSSLSSISVPTGAGQQRTLTVAAGLNWIAGQTGVCVYTANNGVRFTFTVISYSGTSLVVEWLSNTGTGTQATWQINLGIADNTGNLLANQSYLTIPRRISTPQRRASKTTLEVGSFGTGAVTGGFWGKKKFETRAIATVTITNAGTAGNTIKIIWSKSGTYSALFGGLGPLAMYTIQQGDTIANVVAGLVISANLLGVSPVTTSNGTSLTLMAPRGNNTAINGQSLTIVVTGSVAGSSGTFSGGTAIESSTTLSNVFTVDNANNLTRMEQNNDNYTEAFTVNDGPLSYIYSMDSTSDVVTDGTTTRTKISSEGSGVMDWEDQAIIFLTTSPSSPQGLLDVYQVIIEPLDQTIPTEIGSISGAWVERSDGLGLN